MPTSLLWVSSCRTNLHGNDPVCSPKFYPRLSSPLWFRSSVLTPNLKDDEVTSMSRTSDLLLWLLLGYTRGLSYMSVFRILLFVLGCVFRPPHTLTPQLRVLFVFLVPKKFGTSFSTYVKQTPRTTSSVCPTPFDIRERNFRTGSEVEVGQNFSQVYI